MEQLILETNSENMKEKTVIRSSCHAFSKKKSCLSNLGAFYSEVSSLVDEGRAVNIVSLNFSKAFDAVSCNILIAKLAKYRFDKLTVMWIKICLNDRAQRVVVSGMKSSWREVISGVIQDQYKGPVLFNTFSNDLHDGTERTFSKFTGDSELEGVDI